MEPEGDRPRGKFPKRQMAKSHDLMRIRIQKSGSGAGDSRKTVKRATPTRGREPAKGAISTGTGAKNLNRTRKEGDSRGEAKRKPDQTHQKKGRARKNKKKK